MGEAEFSKQSCVTSRGSGSAVQTVWSLMRSCVALRSSNECGVRTRPSLSYDNSYGSFIIELEKANDVPNWGLILAGGSDRGTPVVVASLRKNSVADNSDSLQPGDFIMAVNGSLTDMLRHGDLVDLLVSSSQRLSLEVGYDMQPLLDLGIKDVHRLSYAKAMQIKLTRIGREGLGFILRGGLQEHTGRNFPLTVLYIRPGSPAAEEGSIRVGDRLVAVNGISLFQATLTDALRILGFGEDSAFPCSMPLDSHREETQLLSLTVEYDVLAIAEKSKAKGPITVLVPFSSDGSPLGVRLAISVWDGASIIVEDVKCGSIVDRCGALHPGDRILMINGVSVEGIPVAEVNEILDRRVFSPWRLLILPSHLVSGYTSIAGWCGTDKSLPSSQKETPVPRGFGRESSKTRMGTKIGPRLPRSNSLTRSSTVTREMNAKPPTNAGATSRTLKRADSDPGTSKRLRSDTHIVELWPDYRRNLDIGYCYGFTVSGKTFGEDGLLESPPMISAVDPLGSAKRIGVIQEGDRILSVNGRAFASFSLETLCAAVAQMKPPLSLMLAFDIAEVQSPRSGTFLVSLKLNGLRPGLTFSRLSAPGGNDRIYGVQIETIAVGSPAHRCGCLAPGDVIMSIGEHILNDFWTDEEVLATIQASNDPVLLKVHRDQQPDIGTVLDRVDGFLYKSGSLASNPSLDKSVFDSWNSIYDQMALRSPRGKAPSPSFSLNSAQHSFDSSLGSASRLGNVGFSSGRKSESSAAMLPDEKPKKVERPKSARENANVAESGDDPWEELLKSLRAAGKSPGGSSNSLDVLDEILSSAGMSPQTSRNREVPAADSRHIYDVPDVLGGRSVRVGTASATASSPTSLQSNNSGDSAVEVIRVTLQKDPFYDDFGFSLSDGLSEKGVYVNRVRPNGPADLTGRMRPFDRILRVNGVDAQDFDCCIMVPFVASAGETINLVLARRSNIQAFSTSNGRFYGTDSHDIFQRTAEFARDDFVLSPSAESV